MLVDVAVLRQEDHQAVVETVIADTIAQDERVEVEEGLDSNVAQDLIGQRRNAIQPRGSITTGIDNGAELVKGDFPADVRRSQRNMLAKFINAKGILRNVREDRGPMCEKKITSFSGRTGSRAVLAGDRIEVNFARTRPPGSLVQEEAGLFVVHRKSTRGHCRCGRGRNRWIGRRAKQ